MATTYKRRKHPFEGAEGRSQAIKRIQDEYNVRSKVSPEAQRKAAERTREARNKERQVNSHGGAVAAPKAGGDRLRNLPRRHQTTRGLRRLSLRQAYGRRTTDSSRARVLKLYGRDKPPSPQVPKVGQQGSRTMHKPVAAGSPEQQAARMRARAQAGNPRHSGAQRMLGRLRRNAKRVNTGGRRYTGPIR